MKKQFLKIMACTALFALSLSACDKNKKTSNPEVPPVVAPENEPEVITTMRIYVWDSITNQQIAGSPFSFKDPDGDGGISGGFLNNGSDSLIMLSANRSYKTEIIILDETKTPADSISNEIGGDESFEHMIFYNGDPSNASNASGNTLVNANYPNYTVKLNASNVLIRYADSDNGAENGKPTRSVGLKTYLKTAGASTGSFPFTVTLKHQPGAKDGSYGPGETDIAITFRMKVI